MGRECVPSVSQRPINWQDTLTFSSRLLPALSQGRIAHELVDIFDNLIDLEDIPYLEDVMNQSPLIDFIVSRYEEHGEGLEPLPP